MSKTREISSADCLKKLDDVCKPDPRNLNYIRFDKKLLEYRSVTIKDYYEGVDELKLHAGVPDDVFIQFEKARNLYLYTWFVYRFGQVAELQAFAATEFALRVRYGQKTGKRLQALLNYAIKNNWIRDEDFHEYKRILKRRNKSIELMQSIRPEYGQKPEKR